jgi:deoxyadenosine/deoxycytidine kinase
MNLTSATDQPNKTPTRRGIAMTLEPNFHDAKEGKDNYHHALRDIRASVVNSVRANFNLPDRKFTVGVSGPLAAGKTTLCNELSNILGWKHINEKDIQNDTTLNDWLQKFYGDMKKWGFDLQIALLNSRYVDSLSIENMDESTSQDRTIYEDPVFASTLNLCPEKFIDDEHYKLYLDLFNNMMTQRKYHDIVIFLETSPEKSMENIKRRGRSFEVEKITLDYLKALYERYKVFVQQMSQKTLVVSIVWEGQKINGGDGCEYVDIGYLLQKFLVPILRSDMLSKPGWIRIDPNKSSTLPECCKVEKMPMGCNWSFPVDSPV